MRKTYIPILAGIVLAISGCTSINGVLMSREVERGIGSSAYSLGISEEQVVRDANTDYDSFLTQKEHNNYRLEHIREFKAKDLPTIPELAEIIGLPTKFPYWERN
ncbi:MAG: hypothetical protein Q7S06_02635 [Nanoarchaeota archaeon]|nr:hypothetical protein [Nanoarchaeota archaeon]